MDPGRLETLRTEYESAGIDAADLDENPIEQFAVWLGEAIDADLPEPHAFVLATSTTEGTPSARAVLLRGVDAFGFVFYTNTLSDKASDLSENPRAAMCFLWLALHRQVRVGGVIEAVDSVTADAYFATRPRDSQIGAHASPQSRVIEDRSWLESRVADLTGQFGGQEVPRPPHWGGFRLVPETLEYWQGRANRLHDRLRYRRSGEAWTIERLAP